MTRRSWPASGEEWRDYDRDGNICGPPQPTRKDPE